MDFKKFGTPKNRGPYAAAYLSNALRRHCLGLKRSLGYVSLTERGYV